MKIECNEKDLAPLKVRDHTDNLVVEHTLFDLPIRGLIVARSGQGKNSILSNILMNDHYKYNKIFKGDDIYIFSPRPYDDAKMKLLIDYYEIDDNNIYAGDMPDLDSMEHVYEGLIDEFKEDNKKKPIIIIDDYSSSGKFTSKFNVLVKVFCNSRKFNINIFFLSQYYNHTSPGIRNNANVLIIGNCSNKNLKTITDEHNFLENDKIFKQMFRRETLERFDFFTINYSNSADRLYLNKNFQAIEQAKYTTSLDRKLEAIQEE